MHFLLWFYWVSLKTLKGYRILGPVSIKHLKLQGCKKWLALLMFLSPCYLVVMSLWTGTVSEEMSHLKNNNSHTVTNFCFSSKSLQNALPHCTWTFNWGTRSEKLVKLSCDLFNNLLNTRLCTLVIFGFLCYQK